MDKQQTIQAMEELPLFHLEKVAVNDDETWVQQYNAKAVVENGTTDAIAFVTNRYNLVQFKEVMQPVIDGLDMDFQAQIKQFRGVCIMDIFPNIEEFKDANTKYGITVINSVDKSTGIVVKFNVLLDGNVLSFPDKMAAFVKSHSSKGFKLTKDYINMITSVKESWNNIIQNMPNVQVTEDNIGDITAMFGIKQNNIEALKRKVRLGYNMNAWDIVNLRLKEISYRKFKSDVHKQKALDKLCNGVYQYAVLAGI